jgi:cystathionine beta-lyase
MTKDNPQNSMTDLAHLGSTPEAYNGLVNPPAHRASTIIIKDFDGFKNCFNAPYRYGREGTPSSKAFEHAIAKLDNAHNAIATSSGLAAIINVLNAYSRNGTHLLLPDNFYGFARQYVDETLSKFGVSASYYPPLIEKSDLMAMIKPETSLLYIEAPGSLTYEVQDIGMFVEVAKSKGLKTACDNSWGTPLNIRPLDLGVDISIMSATKYINGHSDIMLGVISCRDENTYGTVLKTVRQSGNCPGSEEVYLGLRGLRTLDVRMKQHREAGIMLAKWLSQKAEVKTVLHPALPSCPGHENWKKYFQGASGVFSFVLNISDESSAERFLNTLKIFKIGFSWGGYESLVFPEQLSENRLSKPWDGDGFLIRLHAGLEDPEDLKHDLETAFSAL